MPYKSLKQHLEFIDNFLTPLEKNVLFYILFIVALSLFIRLYGFTPSPQPGTPSPDTIALALANDYIPTYDLNSVNYEQLLYITGIGPATANAILAYQRENGFTAVDDLKKITGIGERRFQNLRKYFMIGDNPPERTLSDSQNLPTATNTPEKKRVSSHRIDINTASVEELVTLHRIGAVKAQAIVDYRKTHGRFTKIEDITKVKGIGNKTFETIKENIFIGN